jgi:hypothetical protein
MFAKKWLALATVATLASLRGTEVHAQYGPVTNFNRGVRSIGRSLDPSTQTPTQYGRSLAKAPVGVAGMAVATPFLVMQGASNVAKGRDVNAPPPQSTSTLSNKSSSTRVNSGVGRQLGTSRPGRPIPQGQPMTAQNRAAFRQLQTGQPFPVRVYSGGKRH